MSQSIKDYVLNYLRRVNVDPLKINGEEIEYIFKWLSFQKYFESGERDKQGRFTAEQTEGNFIHTHVDKLLMSKGYELKVKYPNGKKFAVCLTHDVDIVNRYISGKELSQFHRKVVQNKGSLNVRNLINHYSRNLLKYSIGKIRSNDPLGCYERWLEVEDKYGFKSTFLFFANPVETANFIDCDYSLSDVVRFNKKKVNVSKMIKEISNAGWEIGLHGSYYSALNQVMFNNQKKRLEDILNQQIISTRQHYLHFLYEKTPQIYENAGIKIDSSVGFNKSYGFNSGSIYPHYLWNFEKHRQSSVFELPLTLMDSSLFKAKNSTKEIDIIIQNCLSVLDKVEKNSGVVTLNWHPSCIKFKDRWEVYEVLLQEIQLKGGWGCTMKQLYTFYENS